MAEPWPRPAPAPPQDITDEATSAERHPLHLQHLQHQEQQQQQQRQWAGQPQEAGVLEGLSPVGYYSGEPAPQEPHTPSVAGPGAAAAAGHDCGAELQLSPFSPLTQAVAPEQLASPFSWPHTPEHLRYDGVGAAHSQAMQAAAAADSAHMATLPQLAVAPGAAAQPGGSGAPSGRPSFEGPASPVHGVFHSLPSSPAHAQLEQAGGGRGASAAGLRARSGTRRASLIGSATAGQRLDVAALQGNSLPPSPRHSSGGIAEGAVPAGLVHAAVEGVLRSRSRWHTTRRLAQLLWLGFIHFVAAWLYFVGCL